MKRVGPSKTICSIFLVLLSAAAVLAQSNQIKYQGSLNTAGTPANGNFDFEFVLFDALNAGNQVGSVLSRNNVAVANGIFAVQLDFGSSFPGAGRFLEIRVRLAGQPGITTLSPRQPVDSSPYSIKSLNADSAAMATNATQLGGVAANQFVVTTDPRMTDARTPTVGSGDYVQNRISPQATTNFNISGNGTVGGTLGANTVNAATQYNISGNHVLSVGGVNNIFVGLNSGEDNTTGVNNSFVGENAGENNTTGRDNSFFGAWAGRANLTGINNSFFGAFAGDVNTTGSNNAFFGQSAGNANTTGGNNSFFGGQAGFFNTTGTSNAFFGYESGEANTSGGGNSFFGSSAGQSNTTGVTNSFFGASAGELNTTGQVNAFFGANAGAANTTSFGNAYFGANAGAASTGDFNSFFGASAGLVNTTGFHNAFFGTVAGAANTTGHSNSFFGYWAGHDNMTGVSNAFFGKFAGEANTTGDTNSFFGQSAGDHNTVGNANSFFGFGAGDSNTTGFNNTFVGQRAGDENTDGTGNTFVGIFAGEGNTTGNLNTAIGTGSGMSDGLSHATAIGAGAVVSTSDTVVLGRDSDIVRIPGFLRVVQLGSPGSVSLCQNVNFTISTCSSSIRYKENINQFDSGLSLIRRLRPVSFNWKDGGMLDMGLVAEEVAEVEPLLITRNHKGEVEGVKYDRVGVVLVNAVKEQQAQIEALRRQVEELKTLICLQNPSTNLCGKGTLPDGELGQRRN